MNSHRKVNPNSKYNADQARLESRHGEALRKGDEWLSEDIDKLLELFLVRKAPYVGTRECYLNELGRTWKSIASMLWKVAVRYPRASVREYMPRSRTRPDGALSKQEIIIIAMALSKTGRKYGACKPYYIAKILNRPVERIELFINDMVEANMGFGLIPYNTDEEKASIVFKAIEYILQEYNTETV